MPELPSSHTSEPFKVVVVDRSKDAVESARDQADARLSEELNEGNGFKRFVKGIWKGNIAKEFYRQRYIQEATNEIQASQDILVHETDLSAEARGRAMDSVIDRYQSEHDELIHEDAGERKEVQSQDSEIAVEFKKMIRSYAEGRLDDTTLREERTRFMQAYREAHGNEAFGKGLVTTDNMVEVARAVMGAVEHGESMDNVIANMQVITGEARDGVRTEARHNKIDSAIDKLSSTKIGSMVGPEVVVSAVTLAATAARWGSQSFVGAAMKTIVPGAGAGLWAGLRENKRVKDERVQHSREAAMGKEFDNDAVRRNEMEKTRYKSISARDLTEFLKINSQPETFDTEGNDALLAALESLAEVQSRIDLSNKRSIDLISYSDAAAIGDERMGLDLARAEVRVALESRLTSEARAELGLDANASVAELIATQSTRYIELLDQDISAKDKAFRYLKARRVGKAAAIGVATGVIGGLVAQELIASIDPTRAGLIEKAWGAHNEISPDGMQHQTLLEGMVEGDDRVLHTGPSAEFNSYPTAENNLGTLNLSGDHTLVENGDGTVNFVDPNGHASIENLAINPNGELPQESLDRLDAAGMKVVDQSFDKDIVTTTTEQVSSEQFVQNHIAETTHVTRDLWYDNDTSAYDQNELKMHWGGESGIVDGGYQLSVAGMLADGSRDGDQSVDWSQAAAQGDLFVSVSASIDTQTQTFMVPIGPDGVVNISADSPAGHFFANVDGQAQFNGAYAEVVQSTGMDAEGVVHTRPLATLVGEGGNNPVTDTITTTTTEHHAVYEITTEGYDTTVQNYTEAAPVIPVASRRTMEAPVRSRENGERKENYYYGGSFSEREREQVRTELSPRLRDNANIHLNPAEELGWFRDEVTRRKGADYIRDVETFIDNDPGMQRIDGETTSIVTIPVGAAFEADNIYGTLSLYAQQDAEGLRKNAVLLNVNWLDTAIADPDKAVLIQKTISEIERAKRDFPDLIVSSMMKEYSQEQAESTGGVIGYVMEDLVNAALLTAQRKIETGVMESNHDLLLVRGDADAKGLSRTLLRNFQRTMAADDDLDVLKGAIRYGAEESKRFPGYGIVSSFMTSFQILATQDNVIHTGGINFGVRMSTLAAVGGLGEMLVENDAGELVRSTGAGSDDVAIGKRIALARGVKRNNSRQYNSAYSGYRGGDSSADQVKRVKLVAGAATDTSADRLLPMYLDGQSPHNVWNPGLATGYAAGPGGYRDRLADINKVTNAGEEDFSDEAVYTGIENALSLELSWASESSGRKALAVYFASVPGAYKITGRFGDDNVRFKLTDKGRAFIKNRVERETNGRYGSYGMRKMRQLYGVVSPGAKRQPASSTPPLVSPLA